jgi:hypothetical protein
MVATSATGTLAADRDSCLSGADGANGANGANGGTDEMTGGKDEDLLKYAERLKREAYADGYKAGHAAAMDAVKKFASQPAAPTASSPSELSVGKGIAGKSMPRGATLLAVDQILRSVAPRALSPIQVIQLSKDDNPLAETSVRRALEKLVERGVAEQVGDSKTWRSVAKRSLRKT